MKFSCTKCHARSDVDTANCDSWICPICKQLNKITIEPWEPGRGWLDETGICHFPSTIQRLPNGLYICGGYNDIISLIIGIVWNSPGPGFEVFDWDMSHPLPREVINGMMGIKMDVEVINWLQEENGGRAFLLGESDGDIQENGLTPDEWIAKYRYNGMGAWIKLRLQKFAMRQGK
jgi:hypothetical protein